MTIGRNFRVLYKLLEGEETCWLPQGISGIGKSKLKCIAAIYTTFCIKLLLEPECELDPACVEVPTLAKRLIVNGIFEETETEREMSAAEFEREMLFGREPEGMTIKYRLTKQFMGRVAEMCEVYLVS